MKRVVGGLLFFFFIALLLPSSSFALSSCAKTFQDLVSTDAQYIPAVGCLNQQYCVVQGTAEGYLLASTLITRAEAVALVARYHVEVLRDWTYVTPATPSFSDVPTTHGLYKEIETAKARGFILGNATGTFDPNGRWVYGYQGPNRSDYNFSLQPADQQSRGGFLKSMYDIGKTRNQLSACVATYCDEATAQQSRPRGLCSNNLGCMRANPYYSSTPDCNSPIQQPTYVNDPTCGPVADPTANGACPATPPTATPTPSPTTPPPPNDGTTCTDVTNANGYVKLAYTAPTTGTYTVWTRMKAGAAATDSYILQIGNQCNVRVGGAGVSTTTWQWINYRDGDTGSKVTVSLTQGKAYTIHLVGRENNVKVDKILLALDPNCVPTGIGDNCTVPPTATPTTVPPPPTNTPTPVPPTPTFTPTPTIAPATPTPTFTPTPTATPVPPTPTATPVPNATTLNFTVILHAIGLGGDNTNPNGRGNFSPLTPSRTMTVELYNASNQLVKTTGTTLSMEFEEVNGESKFSGRWLGTVSIAPGELQSGIYTIRAKVPNYLKGRITNNQQITGGSVNTLDTLTLVVGDTDQDNKLSILDYNKLLKCYSDIVANNNCTDQEKRETDLDDDGKINFVDLQYFIRELATQRGE